jgi:hypothetical protein
VLSFAKERHELELIIEAKEAERQRANIQVRTQAVECGCIQNTRTTINLGYAGTAALAGFSMGTPITEPYSVQLPS